MSVTVGDLLQLPSLRDAEVIAGRGGLKKIVSSISVLEAADPEILNDAMFHNDEFFGSEIVITGFMNVTDDFELQCRNIRRLAEGGEVGLILYYVGVFLKSIDTSLIQVADELDFTLICMPKNRVDLRYSEVICDVMGAIIKDQLSGTSLVVEILERVAKLPQYQQTVDTVLKMLSDRLRATVILTDSQLRVLNEAAWPRTSSGLHAYLKASELPKPSGAPCGFSAVPNGLLYREWIKTEDSTNMELFIIRDSEPLNKNELQQATESVQLAVSLWSQQHERTVVAELVKAILLDEPLKMRRLADLFNIDIASVHTMWVFSGNKFSAEHADAAADCAARFCKTAFADIYDSYLVLFMDGPCTSSDTEVLRDTITEHLPDGVYLSTFTNLENPTDVREAYLANKEFLADAKRIQPQRLCFTGDEIVFARICRSAISSGEEAVAKVLSPLNALHRRRYSEDLELTLSVFLLDSDLSVQVAAELLFLHKNTVKYRLKCISDCIGFTIGQMPASYRLFEAVAVQRLMQSE
ncbi:MAG: PucR family transcriptional regulator [Firmicutes bacterium HGW-Firmicutes-16]|nr:MAG: PucR family transcriptional regulator [Firmicutes bacterium HGW-Firmicutes-16]